ncbi:cation:proton antiporter [Methanobacterium sp. ACI-7]|uniref:cation:proton antiporter domain-containing protein n=1 Tax=unclassified Methanobacterium TaxID=2627676 RepID=UPI0039C05BA5
MEITLLKDIAIIFVLSVFVLYFFQRIRVPTIVGFFITGILAGPGGLGLISAVSEVQLLAEIGVIFLLFTIGIEFSLDKFSQLKRSVLLGGSLQIALTFIAVFTITYFLGLSIIESIFIGFLISLSSTAIVLKILQDNDEIDSPYGYTAFGILIFQDIAVIPMILFAPLLAGASGNIEGNAFIFILEIIGIISFIIVGTKWIIPWALYYIARLQNRELFILSIIAICLSITWLTTLIGVSPALGAFLAGLIISNTEYSKQALGSILPFRDVFISFFFISIGMLFNIDFFFQYFFLIILIVIGVLVLKSLIASLVTAILGFSFRIIVLVGLILSQIGEFSFILAGTGIQYNLLSNAAYQFFISLSVLTMAMTPFILNSSPFILRILSKLPVSEKFKAGSYSMRISEKIDIEDHVIIAGYGVNGRNVAKAAKTADIPYLVIEINPEVVRNEKKKGESIYYGDATHETLLHHVNIENARVLVVAISDPFATQRIILAAKELNEGVYIIVRTRYIQNMEELYNLGADEVIPEEFETSVEIFSRVLAKYLISSEEIYEFTSKIRDDNYEMFRELAMDGASLCSLNRCPSDVEMSLFQVKKNSIIEGKSILESELESKYDVNVLVIFRNSQENEILSNPDKNIIFNAEDTAVLLGYRENISKAAHLFHDKK